MGLLEEYKRGLKSVAVEELFDLVFYRPVAFLFVKLICRTGVTPNQLTLLSMVFGILGGVSLALGTTSALVAGGVFFLLYNIVDCSDGQLARLNHSGTHLGRILDGLADYVVSLAAYVGIGIGYAGASDEPLFMWVLTAVAGFSNAAQSGLLDFYRNRFLDATGVRTSVLVDEQQAFREEYAAMRLRKGKTLEKFLIGSYLLYSRVQNRLTGGRGTITNVLSSDPAEYVRANRILMHCWTYLGPTTQWTLLIVCSFFGRLDIYLWGIAGAGNILALIMLLAQRWTNGHLAMQEG
jgi:phosphatidylglycerophosphate synthase